MFLASIRTATILSEEELCTFDTLADGRVDTQKREWYRRANLRAAAIAPSNSVYVAK